MPPRAPLPALDADDYSARLAIVVPYRDQAEHRGVAQPHVLHHHVVLG